MTPGILSGVKELKDLSVLKVALPKSTTKKLVSSSSENNLSLQMPSVFVVSMPRQHTVAPSLGQSRSCFWLVEH